VHPTSVPSVWKICVMPSLIPIIPLTAIASSLSFAACLVAGIACVVLKLPG
jgi:hypothetical protein